MEIVRSTAIPIEVKRALNSGKPFETYEEFNAVVVTRLSERVEFLSSLSPEDHKRASRRIRRAANKRWKEEKEIRERGLGALPYPADLTLPPKLDLEIAKQAHGMDLSPSSLIVELLAS